MGHYVYKKRLANPPVSFCILKSTPEHVIGNMNNGWRNEVACALENNPQCQPKHTVRGDAKRQPLQNVAGNEHVSL